MNFSPVFIPTCCNYHPDEDIEHFRHHRKSLVPGQEVRRAVFFLLWSRGLAVRMCECGLSSVWGRTELRTEEGKQEAVSLGGQVGCSGESVPG